MIHFDECVVCEKKDPDLKGIHVNECYFCEGCLRRLFVIYSNKVKYENQSNTQIHE